MNQETHDHLEFICNRWYENATTEAQNEAAADWCHGMWIALANISPTNINTMKMVDTYRLKCVERRGEFAKAEAAAYNARNEQ